MSDIIDDLKDPLLLHQAEQYIDSVLGRAIITIEKLRKQVDDLGYSVIEGHLIVEAQKEKIEKLTKELAQLKPREHKTRHSDSSLYDEVCTVCGKTDRNGGLEGSCTG